MISVKMLKNSARMNSQLNTISGQVLGDISRTELKRGIVWTYSRKSMDMSEACKVCKKKLNLNTDKFEKKM